jgi:long-subunit fatty acid transport protein
MNKLLLFFLVLSFNLYSGDFGDVYGAHPAQNAMGNAVTATVNNSSAVFYNPAGLGRLSEGDRINAMIDKKKWEKENGVTETTPAKKTLKEQAKDFFKESLKGTFTFVPNERPTKLTHELTLQYHYANPRLVTSAPSNQDLTKTADNFVALGLAINLNTIYDFKRTVRFGLNIIAPSTGNLLTINDLNPTVHRYLQYGVSNQKPTIMGGLGIEVWKDRFFVGAGFTALIGGDGRILLKDVPLSPNTVTPNQQVILQAKPIVNPTLGFMFQYGKFSMGGSYRREIGLSVDSLGARAQTTLLGIQLDFDVSLYDLFTPRKLAYGIAYKPTNRLTFSVDANRELWSQLGVSNPFLGKQFMSRTKATYSEPFHLVDVTVIRGGAEFRYNDYFTFRAGYARRPKATPDTPGQTNWIDFDRLIMTGGISLTLLPGMKFLENLKNPIIIDIVGEYQKLHGQHVYKYRATDRNPNYSVGGNVWHLGASITMFF